MQDIAAEINAILSDYGDEVRRNMKPVVKKVAQEGVQHLKKGSPRQSGRGRHYATGWRVKIEEKRLSVSAVLHNATKPGLTHLLEHGHAKRGGGRVRAIPHIKPVEEWIAKKVVIELEKELSK